MIIMTVQAHDTSEAFAKHRPANEVKEHLARSSLPTDELNSLCVEPGPGNRVWVFGFNSTSEVPRLLSQYSDMEQCNYCTTYVGHPGNPNGGVVILY
jgi:hypothetical protein